jgi:hypothetical protein
MQVLEMNPVAASDFHAKGTEMMEKKKVGEEREQAANRNEREDYFLTEQLFHRLYNMEKDNRNDSPMLSEDVREDDNDMMLECQTDYREWMLNETIDNDDDEDDVIMDDVVCVASSAAVSGSKGMPEKAASSFTTGVAVASRANSQYK